MEYPFSLLGHLTFQTLLKFCQSGSTPAISFLSLETELNTVCFINYTIPRLCSFFAVQSIVRIAKQGASRKVIIHSSESKVHGTLNVFLQNNENRTPLISSWITATFVMVVSPAVLAHDVSARAGDVSMGIAVFPTVLLAEFTRNHSKNWETVKLRQFSISAQPIREKAREITRRHVSSKTHYN